MKMTIKPFLPVFLCGLFLLASCGKEVSSDKEQLSQSSKEVEEKKQLASGKAIYESNCAGCHASDVAGAPTPGDKADWKERLAQGIKVMAKKSIQGFEGKKGAMPPRGGNSVLTDEELSDAVFYMVKISQ